jgi:polar amino acid transport system substrate-binding protein
MTGSTNVLRICAVLAALWISPVYGTPLTACVSDVPVVPYSYPDREGQAQYLLRTAAEQLGIAVQFVIEPRRRCMQNVKEGLYQFLLVIADTPSLRDEYAFPMRDGHVDANRSFADASAVFVTRSDSKLAWDGKMLRGEHGRILVRAGATAYGEFLTGKGLAWSSDPRSIDAIAKMLIANRSDVAMMRREEFTDLVSTEAYRKQLQMLSPPAFEGQMYIVANREYYEQHSQQAYALWDAIARIKITKAWKQRAPQFAYSPPK